MTYYICNHELLGCMWREDDYVVFESQDLDEALDEVAKLNDTDEDVLFVMRDNLDGCPQFKTMFIDDGSKKEAA